MFLRNYWYVAGRSVEVGRVLLQRWILNEPVLLYRTEDGTAVAMQGNCPHRSLPLSKGRLIEDEVECGYHGLKFAPSGECTHVPALDKVPATCRVKTYPVVDMNRWVWIWMGDPALADEATIPDCRWNDDPEWSVTEGHLEIGCNYALLVDNLLDLSHTAFVHRDSIGDRSVAEAPANTEVSGNSVSVIRRLQGRPAASVLCDVTRLEREHRQITTHPMDTAYLRTYRFVDCACWNRQKRQFERAGLSRAQRHHAGDGTAGSPLLVDPKELRAWGGGGRSTARREHSDSYSGYRDPRGTTGDGEPPEWYPR